MLYLLKKGRLSKTAHNAFIVFNFFISLAKGNELVSGRGK